MSLIARRIKVHKCVETKLGVKLSRIGLMLNPKYPISGASPDALCAEHIVEIKCPQHEKDIMHRCSYRCFY
nr:unnamed protein product [Callosobruchus chinensis]